MFFKIRSWRRHTLLGRSSQRIPVGSERPDRGAGLYTPAGAVPGAAGLLPGGILQQDVRHYPAPGTHIWINYFLRITYTGGVGCRRLVRYLS